MINKFINNCLKNKEKIAIIDGKRKISYGNLLNDIYKMINLFKENNLNCNEKILLLVLPSYEFYVLLLASIYYGLNIVVLDAYNDTKRIAKMLNNLNVKYAFCTKITKLFKYRLKIKLNYLDITTYQNYSSTCSDPNIDSDRIVLTTFTSGTSNIPKSINRSVNFLEKQIDLVSDIVKLDSQKIIYSNLPIYVLYLLYTGFTCVISNKINKKIVERENIDTAISSINKIINQRQQFSNVKHLYLGGAFIHYVDYLKIIKIFPNAEIDYIYGASESAIIGKTPLEYYINNNYAFKEITQNITLNLNNIDKNGIGRISVKGELVIGNQEHQSNDLAYIDHLGLHIVGLYQYSTNDFYNYLIDDKLLKENPKVKKGFSLVYKNKKFFCYEGKVSKKELDICYIKFRKLPMDLKHKTKVNYQELVKKINLLIK